MWTYYRDVTLYALVVVLFIAFASSAAYDSFLDGVINAIIIFGVFGSGLGVLAFNYFQKAQYYMYHNLGFTKAHLIKRTWFVNLIISILLLGVVALFL